MFAAVRSRDLHQWHRVHVLTLPESARTTTAKAAKALGIGPRQLRRLRAKLRAAGLRSPRRAKVHSGGAGHWNTGRGLGSRRCGSPAAPPMPA